jgi:opacity protein-like surface antigen
MKKKLLLPLLVAGMWATPAFAKPYISASAGLGLVSNSDITDTVTGATLNDALEYKSGVALAVALGVQSDDYRIEGAVGYQNHDVDKVMGVSVSGYTVSALSLMLNGYYDFTMKDSPVAPYLTAGAGAVRIFSEGGGSSDHDDVFAWQVGTGVGIKASECVVFDLGYRYFKPSDITSNGVEVTLASHNFLAGVRYSF